MLPFLKYKNKGTTTVVADTREPDDKSVADQDEGDHAIRACARDLIQAVHAKDEAGVADALKAAFEVFESQPHEESNEEPSES